ncbi:hypothetical protein BOTBODRAFT_26709 [Botryobasidium botryosum FD-172 SS1]|uniref:Uncharacterized protein n=1 Tax=Botryobasidium botryosum (strain FD-172 SS1) TaxID=930990 RepID=A0A067NA70_BOTB1|nr:hypothetical protein BOTBODRAFT_26709 [Botryobasidium botryosum FD-172 SS1]
MDNSEDDAPASPAAIRIYIPSRIYALPVAATTIGLCLGMLRGSRKASLRFLAENAHKRPTTIQGWYFYNKTKNYKVFLGGLKQGGIEALKLGTLGLGWVGIQEGCTELGWNEWKDLVAGGGTAMLVSGVYRLPRTNTLQALAVGLLGGGAVSLLRKAQEWVASQAEAEAQIKKGDVET